LAAKRTHAAVVEASRKSRAVFIIPGPEVDFRQNRMGGTSMTNPATEIHRPTFTVKLWRHCRQVIDSIECRFTVSQE
jgi:hypothetical protein